MTDANGFTWSVCACGEYCVHDMCIFCIAKKRGHKIYSMETKDIPALVDALKEFPGDKEMGTKIITSAAEEVTKGDD